MEDAKGLQEGDSVSVVERDNWTSDMARLAKSGRVGILVRIFTPMGASRPVCRVVFPKTGRFKNRIEFFAPTDLQSAKPA